MEPVPKDPGKKKKRKLNPRGAGTRDSAKLRDENGGETRSLGGAKKLEVCERGSSKAYCHPHFGKTKAGGGLKTKFTGNQHKRAGQGKLGVGAHAALE